ncbi:disease resistance protein At4g27190-like isoform X2 [Macadamia integrifolia]|nr:disease resistance protein At4g27190-like isoform X2 [Macadamia integrifolia]
MDVKVFFCQRIRYVRHFKRIFELLKLKTEVLRDIKDALNEEINRELLHGKVLSTECRKWLEKIEEIEHQIHTIMDAVEIFQKHRNLKIFCPDISLHMKVGEKMDNIIKEIAFMETRKHSQLGSVADAPSYVGEPISMQGFKPVISEEVGTTNQMSIGTSYDVGKVKPVVITETATAWRMKSRKSQLQHGEVGTRRKQRAEKTKRKKDEILSAPDKESEITHSRTSAAKKMLIPEIGSTMMSEQRIEAGMNPATETESKMKAAVKGDEANPETLPISITEDFWWPAVVPEKVPLPRSKGKSFSVPEIEVEMIHSEPEEYTEFTQSPSPSASPFYRTGLEGKMMPVPSVVPEKIPSPRLEGNLLFVPEIEVETIHSELKEDTQSTPAPSSRTGIEGIMMCVPEKAKPIKAGVEDKVTPAVTEHEVVHETIPISIPISGTEIESLPDSAPPPSTVAGLKPENILVPRTVGKMLPKGEIRTRAIPTEHNEAVMVRVPGTKVKRSFDYTLQKILKDIKDVTSRKIGIHGKGGIGKTTVLKALNDQTKMKSIFDVVIWVTVSKGWSLNKIQNDILQQLSSYLPNDISEYGNTSRLFQLLKGRKFLLLLDDVWEWVDLDKVGIPDPNTQNNAKVVLTTRSIDICQTMGADRIIEVEAMLPEESWELFHEKVGEIIDSPNIQPFARTIIEVSGGFPLMIILYGKALRKESDVLVWRHALRALLSVPMSDLEGDEYVVQQFKFCYDQLKDVNVKSCFLSCAMYPEDHEIDIAKLMEYWFAEGFIIGSWADTQIKGHNILKVLLDASLLESVGGGSVKMHDVIRDLALGIMSLEGDDCRVLARVDTRLTQLQEGEKQEQSQMDDSVSRLLEDRGRIVSPSWKGHRFLSRAGLGQKLPPEEEEWEQAERIFLMDNELTSLPQCPNCPNLLTLLLQRNERLRMIPESFFDFMPSLQVLNLSKTRIKYLPSSISKVVNLRELILRHCQRLDGFPSELGKLQRLQVLDLHGADVDNLPAMIGELTCLRLLDVSFYGYVGHENYGMMPPEMIPHGTIKKLFQLKDLRIVVDPEDQRWNESVGTLTFEEVATLKDLTTLCYYFPEVELVEMFIKVSPSWKDQRLRKFTFTVGHLVKSFVSRVAVDVEMEYEQQGQCLRFVNGLLIPDAIVEILAHTRAFYLDHHCTVHSLSEFGVRNMSQLRFCIVSECPKIQTIVEGMLVSALPLLEHLSIHHLLSLRSIWEGPMALGSLARLKYLALHTCPKLRYIFSTVMLQCLSNLEELVVEDCPGIEEVIEGMTVEYDVLPRLKRLSLHYLPELVGIWKGAWCSLEQTSFYNCPKLKNLSMGFQFPKAIKEIKGERDWWNELEWEETALFLRLQSYFMPISEGDL